MRLTPTFKAFDKTKKRYLSMDDIANQVELSFGWNIDSDENHTASIELIPNRNIELHFANDDGDYVEILSVI
jgi:hypothetical protein